MELCIAYKPKQGECRAFDTEAQRMLRKETGEKRLFTWWKDGEWWISYRYDNGLVVDVTPLPGAGKPILKRGTLFSMKTWCKSIATERRSATKNAMKMFRERERAELEARQNENDTYVDMRRSARRRLSSQVLKDHPYFKV